MAPGNITNVSLGPHRYRGGYAVSMPSGGSLRRDELDLTSERLPILQDVVYRLTHGAGGFIQYEIVHFEDLDFAIEELTEFQDHHTQFLLAADEF